MMKKTYSFFLALLLVVVMLPMYACAEPMPSFGIIQFGLNGDEFKEQYGVDLSEKEYGYQYYSSDSTQFIDDIGIEVDNDNDMWPKYFVMIDIYNEGSTVPYFGKDIENAFTGLKSIYMKCIRRPSEKESLRWFDNTKSALSEILGEATLLGTKPPKGITTKVFYDILRSDERSKEYLYSPETFPLEVVHFAQWEIDSNEGILLADLFLFRWPKSGEYGGYINIEAFTEEEFNTCKELANRYQEML